MYLEDTMHKTTCDTKKPYASYKLIFVGTQKIIRLRGLSRKQFNYLSLVSREEKHKGEFSNFSLTLFSGTFFGTHHM